MKLKSKNFTLFTLYWLPFLVWALVIFSFSSRTTRPVSTVQLEDFIVKKGVHLIEYAIFTVLLFRALKKSGMDRKNSLLYSLLAAIVYGATDEFHQSFTPGREPRVRDVIIDTAGSIIAIFFITKILPFLPKKYLEIPKSLEII